MFKFSSYSIRPRYEIRGDYDSKGKKSYSVYDNEIRSHVSITNQKNSYTVFYTLKGAKDVADHLNGDFYVAPLNMTVGGWAILRLLFSLCRVLPENKKEK